MNSVLYGCPWGKQLVKKLMKPQLKPKHRFETSRWNIVRGDKVEVTEGPCAGQKGTVLSVLRKSNRVVVDGVNLRRRIVKGIMDGMPGKMVTKPCAVHYSNVMLVDPSTGKPTKISRKYLEDGSKVRVSKRSGVVIPKPNPLKDRPPRTSALGAKDTHPDTVNLVTFPDYEKYLKYIYESKAGN